MRSSTSKYASHTERRPWTAQTPASSRPNTQVRPKLISNAVENQKRKPHPTLWDRLSHIPSLFRFSSAQEEDTASDNDDFESAQEDFEPDEADQDHGHYDEDSPKYGFSFTDFLTGFLSDEELEQLVAQKEKEQHYIQAIQEQEKEEQSAERARESWNSSLNKRGRLRYFADPAWEWGLPSMPSSKDQLVELHQQMRHIVLIRSKEYESNLHSFLNHEPRVFRIAKYDLDTFGDIQLAGIRPTMSDLPDRSISPWLDNKPFTPEYLLFIPDLSSASLKTPGKQKPRLIRRHDKDMPIYTKASHFRGPLQEFPVLHICTRYAYAEEANDQIEEGYNIASSDGDFGKSATASWRAGAGRKKSWKTSPKGKVPSRRQRRQGKRTIRNVEHCSDLPQRQQQNPRLRHEKCSSDLYVQIHRYRSAKHRAHYIWVDDHVQYATSPHVTVEPRVSIQTAEPEHTGANLVSLGRLITATRRGSKEMYDATSWAFRRSPREEVRYQSFMAAVLPQLLSGPLKKAPGRGKKHKQRGISKFNIPRIKDLVDFGVSLKGLWVSLQNKSTLLLKLAAGQESASPESCLKLYKTVEARKRQLIRLENVYATMNAKYKQMENEERAMEAELNRIHRWLMSVAEQDHVMALHSALHKDRFIDVLPQPQVKCPPQHPLLHKNGIIESGPESMTRLLDSLSDDGQLVKVFEQIHGDISNWSTRQCSMLQDNLQNCMVVGNSSK